MGNQPLPRSVYSGNMNFNPTQVEKPDSHTDLLEESRIEQSAAKVGIFGLQGSGKSTMAALIALGLSKTYHNNAPVAYHDTENGSDFLKPLFDMEGVKLLVRKSRCFADAGRTLAEAQRKGCCAFIEDSVTGDWDELVESFKKKKGITRLQINHWGELKPDWTEKWVLPMLNSPLHVISCGRAGDIWERREDEDGKEENVKVGTKLRAEGQFGYEPSLLIEMLVVQNAMKGGRKRKDVGRMLHTAFVLKDRSRALQGRTIEWPDINTYKADDWKKYFTFFNGHFAFLNIGGKHVAMNPGDSTGLFDQNGNGDWYKRKKRIDIALEEIDGSINALFPGASAASKKYRGWLIEILFETRSWTKVTETPLGTLEMALDRLQRLERNTKNTLLDTDETVIAVLKEVREFQSDEQVQEAQTDKDTQLRASLSDVQRTVYAALLPTKDIALNALIELTGIPAQEVSAALTDMELKGFVGQIPGKRFVKVPLNRVVLEEPVAVAG